MTEIIYKNQIKKKTWTGEYDLNKYFRSSSKVIVHRCEFFGHVQHFRSYSFGHLDSVKWLLLQIVHYKIILLCSF